MGTLETAYESTHRPTDEKILIASLTNFTHRADVRETLHTLNPEDFYNSMYGEIWAEARALSDDSRIITPEALKTRFEKAHKGRDGEPPQWRIIEQAYGQPVRLVEVVRGAALVAAAAKRRRLVDILKRAAETVTESEDYETPLGVAHSGLAELDDAEKSDEAVSIEDSVDSFWHNVDNPDDASESVMPTPWPSFNEFINGGVSKKRFYLFGAESGGGKSLAMLNCAVYAAMKGYKVAIFSIEMDAKEITSRLISSVGGFKYSQISQHRIDAATLPKVQSVTAELKSKAITIYDQSNVSMQFIRQQALALKRPEGLDMIIVDYVQIVEPEDAKANREQQVGDVGKRMKLLANELDVAVLSATQLNDNEQGNRPTMRSLRESKALGMHADAVILLNHEKSNGDRTGNMEFILAKNRVGRTGSVPLVFEADMARIGNMRSF